MNSKTKKIAAVGILCALAYGAVAVGRIPLVLFLKYDPKDVVIAFSGFAFGPSAALASALIVSLAELLLPVFLPFNLIKGGLNAVIAMLLYQPVTAALRRSRLWGHP